MTAFSLPAPFRPLPLRVLNAAAPRLRRWGWRGFSLEQEELLGAARRRTGLADFGEESFRPGLVRLLESLEEDARLNAFGRYFARRQVLELLVHRLRLTDHRKRHLEVAQQRLERPLFVVGLPRTGTTVLFGLLALDPGHRSPLSWEVDDPCPPPETTSYRDDPRIRRTERRLEQLRRLAPGFQAIHPVGALLPQECVVITAAQFYSLRFEMCFDIRGYQRWLLDQDLGSAYRFHRHFLQHLQSRRSAPRWVLKSPGHLGSVDALLAEYPDALIVQTHRDPIRVIPSVSSLEYTMRCVSSDHVDPRIIGQQQLHQWSTLLERSIRARDRVSARGARILDLHYRDIEADPIACLRRVYAHFDLELEAGTIARARAFLRDHPRNEHGTHRYSLDAFGLETEALREAFKAYYERFDVEPEAPS